MKPCPISGSTSGCALTRLYPCSATASLSCRSHSICASWHIVFANRRLSPLAIKIRSLGPTSIRSTFDSISVFQLTAIFIYLRLYSFYILQFPNPSTKILAPLALKIKDFCLIFDPICVIIWRLRISGLPESGRCRQKLFL